MRAKHRYLRKHYGLVLYLQLGWAVLFLAAISILLVLAFKSA